MIYPYHKINGLYKRYGFDDRPIPADRKKGDFILGEWSKPEFGYLADCPWIWTEKLDGTNICMRVDRDSISYMGRTAKSVIQKPLSAWIDDFIVRFGPILRDQFADSLDTGVHLYFEGVGEKIQNGDLFGQQHCVLLDIRIGDWWLNRLDVSSIAGKVRIRVAPIMIIGTINEAIEFVKGHPKSAMIDDYAEGIVGHPMLRLKDAGGKRIVTKVKWRDFK